jgi:hypothetical protein
MSTRKLHPAIDVDGETLLLARVTDDMSEVHWITSDRRLVPLDEIKDRLRLVPRPLEDLVGRWPGDNVTEYITSRSTPSFLDVATLYHRAFSEALEFPDPMQTSLAVAWAMGTYFHRLFRSYPRLLVTGEFESGKSKLMELLTLLCWNAPCWGIPTAAPVFRVIHEWRPTLMLDEMEHLDKEEMKNLVAIINAGYKRTIRVPRVEGDKQRHTETFEVYSPMAIAGIRGANLVTASRCVPISLLRALDTSKLNFEVDAQNALYAEARSYMHWVLLGRWREVQAHYEQVEVPSWLNGRPRELWKPLLVIADMIDRENPRGVVVPPMRPSLVALAREYVRNRESVRPEIEALVRVLQEKLASASTIELAPKDLTQPLQDQLGWPHPPDPRQIGRWLEQLGCPRRRTKTARMHVVDQGQLEIFIKRYGLDVKTEE